MTLHELYSRLKNSSIFKRFHLENPQAILCTAFLVLNFKNDFHEYSLDFRNEEKIFTFKLPEQGEIVLLEEEILDKTKPLEAINLDVKIDLEDLKEIIEKSLIKNNIKNKLEETIAVLQVINNELVWHMTIMCEGFVVINSMLHSETGEIIKFEKKNLFDFVKK